MGVDTLFYANTFLIGAQKSGTTYLASLLGQSAAVCVSDPKEPQFFSSSFDRGPGFYERCFGNKTAPIRLDASTTYSFLRPRHAIEIVDAPGLLVPVPQRIKEHAPDARFIYIMRDPVQRAASAYRHNARFHPVPRISLSLIECMRADPMLELVSRYSYQIERYFEVFPPDRFLFLKFGALTREPMAVVQRTCAFLDIPTTGISIKSSESKKHGAYQLTIAGKLAQRAANTFPRTVRALEAAMPASLKDLFVDRVIKRPSDISFYDEDAAADLFLSDRERVFKLTGLRI